MYPKPRLAQALKSDSTLIHRIQDVLNHISLDQLLGQGRVYGGGLHKLEPNELANVNAKAIAALILDFKESLGRHQLGLFGDVLVNNGLTPLIKNSHSAAALPHKF